MQMQEPELVQQLGQIIDKKVEEKVEAKLTTYKKRSLLAKIFRRNAQLQYLNPKDDPPTGDPIIDRTYTRELKGGQVETTVNLIFIKRHYVRELGPGTVTTTVKLWLQQIRSMMLLSVFCVGSLFLIIQGGSAVIPWIIRLLEILPVMALAPALLLIPMGIGLTYAYVNTSTS